jgi:hypothetical protein
MRHDSDPAPRDTSRTRMVFALCVFLAIAAFFLFTGHAAHVFGVLPFLLLLACPFMHLFMHHGHNDTASQPDPPAAHSHEGATPEEPTVHSHHHDRSE